MDHGLTLHYYVQFLHYALTCLKELDYDTLKNIKTVRLTVDENNEVDMPSDYVDWTKVGIQRGHLVQAMGVNSKLNKLQPESGTYTDIYDTQGYLPVSLDGLWFSNFLTDKGEHTGNLYGHGNGASRLSFTVVPEREVIRFDIEFEVGTKILLEYIYFTSATVTSLINPYAENTIRAYINWRYKDWSKRHTRFDVAHAKDEYYNELRILRARMNPVTKVDVLRVTRGGNKQSIKS